MSTPHVIWIPRSILACKRCTFQIHTYVLRFMDTAGENRLWVEVGSDSVCDTSAGEVYLDSSGYEDSLEKCQELCAKQAECKSITFYTSNDKHMWCSRYSTSCSKVKKRDGAKTLRLIPASTAPSQSTTTIVTTTTAMARKL